MPVYNLADGEFTGELCNLDSQHFNNQLRRDLVSKVFHFYNVKGVIKSHIAKTKGDVAGSGKKPAPQKGRGMARIGNKRAPHRAKGGTAHGPKLRDLTEKLPAKIRLKALQIMLSAKLYEDKLIMIDSESIELAKTGYLNEIVKPFGIDRLLFLTPFDTDKNFIRASQNIRNVKIVNPAEFNVNPMMRSDLIFVTKEGLLQLEEIIESRQANLFRNRNIPRDDLPFDKYFERRENKKHQPKEWKEIIKPTLMDETFAQELQGDKELEVFTPALRTYLDELRALRQDDKN